jgi:hypothetical protein
VKQKRAWVMAQVVEHIPSKQNWLKIEIFENLFEN